MVTRSSWLADSWRRAWWRGQGEQVLVLTFWPQHYWRGQEYYSDGQRYRITRYARAAAQGYYEVWGKRVRLSNARRICTGPGILDLSGCPRGSSSYR